MADIVATKEGRLLTDSLRVSEHFGKHHRNVIRAIRSLNCSKEFHLLNFEQVIRRVKGGKNTEFDQPFYTMTKDGFMFLVMGFGGLQAGAIKESYINAFNQMSQRLTATMTEFNLECHRMAVGERFASRCGKGLRQWREEKPRRLGRLKALHPQLVMFTGGN